MSDRIGGVLRRRPALLAACALPAIILMVAYMQSTRGLEQQVRELQRENLALRLSQASAPRRRPEGSDASFARSLPANGVLAPALAGFVALLAALVAASVVVVLKRYYGHRLAVDSRYKAIIDQTNDGIVIVDSKRHEIQYCNPAFLERIGYSKSEAQGLTLPDIFADANAPPEGVLARLSSADSQMALNLQLRCKNGALIDVEVRCNRLESDGREGLAYVTHDVSVRRKAEQQLIDNQQRLDRMAHHDQLTGLPNRHYLTTFLPQAILEARAASTMLGVVFLDLDRFKHINDTRGHETGDKLLQEVAGRLRTCVRDSDVVIRMGGDELECVALSAPVGLAAGDDVVASVNGEVVARAAGSPSRSTFVLPPGRSEVRLLYENRGHPNGGAGMEAPTGILELQLTAGRAGAGKAISGWRMREVDSTKNRPEVSPGIQG